MTGEDAGATPDAGAPDAGAPDAGPGDDGGIADAGDMDAGAIDAGGIDAGPPDAGTAVGLACTAAQDCASGFCVDGVCCESACAGPCESCALAGRAGFCDAVPAGADPDAECAAQAASSCGTTGECSGSRSCALHPPGTECAAASCSAATSSLADTCNGLGVCVDNGTASCAPFACDGATGRCRSTCTSAGDCVSGFACTSAGLCKKAAGQACSAAGDCASGFCADGVCCDAACTGTCERCDQAGRVGSCDPLPAATDPDNECATQAASTCGTTGACSGARSCALHPASTVCAAASCAGSSAQPADTCDGNGTCVDSGAVSCAPFGCDSATGTCRTTCAVAGDCAGAGFTCSLGVCKKDVGAACTGTTECASGFCTDGICCSAACTGTCERCNLAGSLGTCAAVPAGQDPDNECAAQAASTCGTTGECSGARTCQRYANGTVCVAASCAGSTSQLPDLCTNGVCADSGSVACGLYACNAATGTCRTTCTVSTDCASGYDCATGGVCKRMAGSVCVANTECASGFCTDGVCCNQGCFGTCEKCNLAGSLGACTPIALGQDPDGECGASPASTCGTNGSCSGARSCALYPSGTVCAAASCTAGLGSSQPADSCNGTGTCVDSGAVSCGLYLCNPASGLCRTTCGSSVDCAAGRTCSGGTCQ